LHVENALNLPNQKPSVLNQRVSHNLDDLTKANVSQTPTEKLTEPPKSTTVIPKAEEKMTESTNSRETILSLDDIEAVLNVQIENLKAKQTPVSFHFTHSIIFNEFTCLNCVIKIKVTDEISKRVKIFTTNWPKLSENVKQKMSELVKQLDAKDFKTANYIHVKLMLDYSFEVSQWMVGIKKLIHLNLEE
jgi:hypothetical protein